MSCLRGDLSKQDQITGRVLGGSLRIKEKRHPCWLATTQIRNEQNLLDSGPSLITSAQHTPESTQPSLFTAAKHSIFFQTRAIAFSKSELDMVPP